MCVSLMHQDMRLLILYSHWLMDLMMVLYYQRKYMYIHTSYSATYTYNILIHVSCITVYMYSFYSAVSGLVSLTFVIDLFVHVH